MKRPMTLVGVLAGVCSMLVQAQTAQAPRPGADHKKLAVFLGSWSLDGEFKPGNGYGVPAGKFSVVERFQWMPGEFFLQMNREGKGPGGETRHMIIYGYDSVAKRHIATWYELVGGGTMSATFTNAGNQWHWFGRGHTRDGKPYQERCATTFVSATSATLKCETSPDGKVWSPALDAKSTRSKP
jgi:hypothetical protein